MSDSSAPGGGVVPLRRNRDFVLFWGGQVVSTAGSRATQIAYPLLALSLTGSAARAGVVGFANTLPFLIWFLPAGALVDRWNRKRVMLACDVFRFAAVGSIAGALVMDQMTLTHLIAVAFLEGSCLVFFELAEAAALPHIVPERQLTSAVAQNEARQQAADLTGQPIGGALFELGRSFPFVFDGLSYLVSFFTLLAIEPDFQDGTAGEPDRSGRPGKPSILGEIGEGLRFLFRQPFLRTCSGLAAVLNFTLSALVLAVVVRLQELGHGGATTGLVLAAFSVGALLGVAAAPTIHRWLPPRAIVVSSISLVAAAWALVAAAPNPITMALALAAGSAALPWFQVLQARFRYALTPDALQGRVVAAFRVLGWGAIPLGAASSGLALEAYGAVPTIAGLACIVAALALVSSTLDGLHIAPLDDD